jgi:hypothetical protein
MVPNNGNITTGTELVRRRMNVGEASICYDVSVDYKSTVLNLENQKEVIFG